MREREPSELDIAMAFRVFLEDAPTEVRPAELADRLARAHPRRRTVIGGWRFELAPSIVWIVLLAALLLALVAGTLIAGAGRPAVVSTTGTVSITIDGLVGVKGQQLAAIIRDVGGFKVAIDEDPFTVTQTIRDGSPLIRWFEQGSGADARVPEAKVPAGTYPVDIWVGEEVGIYSDWMPTGLLSLYCHGEVTVSPGWRTELRVTGLRRIDEGTGVLPNAVSTRCETD